MTDAKKYGHALYELSAEEGKEDAVLSSLELIEKAFSENKEYVSLLDTPALPKSEKLALIDEAFGSFDEHLKSTLKLLAEAHSVYLFPALRSGYSEAYDKAKGIERVQAVTAVPMSNKQLAALKSALEAKTGKKIIITNKTDSSVLGGMRLNYMGVQLDSTLKTKLEGLRDLLAGTVI